MSYPYITTTTAGDTLDLPLGGVVVTGSIHTLFELAFGHAPRTPDDEARALSSLRLARKTHSALTCLWRVFPEAPCQRARIREDMRQERRAASEAVAAIQAARMAMRRAAA